MQHFGFQWIIKVIAAHRQRRGGVYPHPRCCGAATLSGLKMRKRKNKYSSFYLDFSPKSNTFATAINIWLSHGVMVALQFLVLSVVVRVRLGQRFILPTAWFISGWPFYFSNRSNLGLFAFRSSLFQYNAVVEFLWLFIKKITKSGLKKDLTWVILLAWVLGRG